MAVIAKLDYTQSTNGKILTFIDSSDWATSGEDINSFIRTVQLYNGPNATGTLLDTLTFQGSQLTVTYDIDSDTYFSAKYTAAGDVNYIFTINFGTTAYEWKRLNELTSKGCGCGNKAADDKTRYGFIFLMLAEKSVLEGNAARFNQNIKASAEWLR